MDILTPASIWSSADHVEVMPLPQRIAMLVTVIGPPTGFGIGAAILWGRGTIGWPEIMTMVAMYSATGFGVTIGFHRLLTHRSFETFRPVRLLLAILGSAAAQGMVIKWCAIHRRHHQESDREGDPHSPHLHGQPGFRGLIRGLWYAHVGWAFEADKPQLQNSIRDLLADRAMVMVDRLYLLWVAIGLIVPAAVLGLYYQSWNGALAGLVWGGLLRIFIMHHATWSINSVCHVFGNRPFASGDHSTNNFPIAIVSLGEGWHNNHHAFPNSARHGLRWWQFDSSYIIIRTMSLLGLVWNVRVPSDEAMLAKARRATVVKS
jgi:stearoyl-CoA desaturase (Delta-9 desaturase)